MAVESVNRDRRVNVSNGEVVTCEKRWTQILRALTARAGSKLDPTTVAEGLQCMAEDRDVLPGHGFRSPIYPQQTIPAPMYQWMPLAWTDISRLGLKRFTALMLRTRLRIFTIGSLLLYTEAEVASATDAEVLRDLKVCLYQSHLRLPSPEELAQAKESGWWVELHDWQLGGPQPLRVARELAPYVPIIQIKQLHRVPVDFWERNGLNCVGDLLAKTSAELLELLQIYQRSFYTNSLNIWPSCDEHAADDHRFIVQWIRDAGLALTA